MCQTMAMFLAMADDVVVDVVARMSSMFWLPSVHKRVLDRHGDDSACSALVDMYAKRSDFMDGSSASGPCRWPSRWYLEMLP